MVAKERKRLWVLVAVNRFRSVVGVDSSGRLISMKFLGLVLARIVLVSWFL